MKILLRIAGILLILASVFCFLMSGLSWFSFKNVLDGSASLYERLEKNTFIYLAAGLLTAAAALLLRRAAKK